MRALVILAIATMLLASQAAAECPTPALTDPFAPAPECSAYQQCGVSLCQCVGESNETDADTCVVAAGAECSDKQTCLAEYTTCLQSIVTLTHDVHCGPMASAIHSGLLIVAMGGYPGSDYQLSCQRRVCQVLNGTCEDVNACTAPAVNTTTNSTTAPARYAIRVTFRLSGTAWAGMLADPTLRAQLEASLRDDLAALLGVDPEFIVILDLQVGSLIVEFAVLEEAGVSPSVLQARTAAATTSTAWLSSTKAVYATVSDEEIEVLEFNVVEVGEEPETPEPTSGRDEPEDDDSVELGAAPMVALLPAAVAAALGATVILAL